MYLKDFCRLIGKSADSEEVRGILEGYDLVVSSIDDERDKVSYLSVRNQGFHIRCDSHGIITAIFLYGDARDGFLPFSEEIAPGVTLEKTRESLQNEFGPPVATGTRPGGFLSAGEAVWDEFTIEGAAVLIEYSEKDGHIELITLFRKPPKSQ